MGDCRACHSGLDADACNSGAPEDARAKDRAMRGELRNRVKETLELLQVYQVAEAMSALEKLHAWLAVDGSE